MKRLALLILIASAATVALVMSQEPDPSVEYHQFRMQFTNLLRRGGFTFMALESCNPQDAPIPLAIQWHPRRWFPRTADTAPIGFHGGSEIEDREHYTLKAGNAAIVDCFVVHLDGRASYMVIRAQAGGAAAASNLRSALASEFPGLPIELRSNVAS
jgi:hypothetical protein